MTKSPFQTPNPESTIDELSKDSTKGVRKGVGFVLALIWNIPIVSVFYPLFTGAITERTANILLACWAAMIPIFALSLAYTPILQRLLFKPSFDIGSKRAGLWALASLWTVISGTWLVSIFLSG